MIGLITSLLTATAGHAAIEPLPVRLEGSWRITRVLPTTNDACWPKERAATLVGSTLVYHATSMSWKEGAVPVDAITSRTVTDAEFRKESSGSKPATFAQLGITTRSVTEVNMQHEDQDITGSSTEVPGDSILLAGPRRIVVSACGVYMEATKAVVSNAAPKRKAHR
jgi:hypothetical protein